MPYANSHVAANRETSNGNMSCDFLTFAIRGFNVEIDEVETRTTCGIRSTSARGTSLITKRPNARTDHCRCGPLPHLHRPFFIAAKSF